MISYIIKVVIIGVELKSLSTCMNNVCSGLKTK
jgi:hypothetical protein